MLAGEVSLNRYVKCPVFVSRATMKQLAKVWRFPRDVCLPSHSLRRCGLGRVRRASLDATAWKSLIERRLALDGPAYELVTKS